MKKIIALVLTLTLCLAFVPGVVCAAEERDLAQAETLATELKNLGILHGVRYTDFQLNREPTRLEAITMLIRISGKEKAALGGEWNHPFKDVPYWADKYVGYAYANSLTNGIAEDKFGTDNADSAMFVTFMLRALGYKDVNSEDFSWDNPYPLAENIGLLDEAVNTEKFLRADMVTVVHNAMVCCQKGTEQTLADSLIGAGVFTRQSFYDNYKAKTDLVYKPEPETEIASGNCSRQEMAFEVLKAYICEEGSINEEGQNEYVTKNDYSEYRFWYDEDNNQIMTYVLYFPKDKDTGKINSKRSISVSFKPDDTVFESEYIYYAYDESKEEFVIKSRAICNMEASECRVYVPGRKYIFNEYEGDNEADDADYAAVLHSFILGSINIMMDSVRFTELYTVKDFGYVE